MRSDERKWCKRCGSNELTGDEEEYLGEEICLECKLIEDIRDIAEEIQSIDARLKPIWDKFDGEYPEFFTKESEKARLQILKENKEFITRREENIKLIYEYAKSLMVMNKLLKEIKVIREDGKLYDAEYKGIPVKIIK